MLASSHGTLPHCELLHQNPRLQTDPPQNQRHANPRIYRESACLFLRVYLKSRKFSLFLQTQRDFALKRLGIHKGFLRLSALNPAVFAKYPSFSLFSDTPPAPSFQSILCKLQPLTRHSVRHLPYNIRGATLCKFATDLFEAAMSCCNFAQGIARILCRPFPKRVGKTHRIALFPYAAYRWKNAQVTPETVAFYTGYSRSPAPP